jgi:hypothetical protein
MRRISKKTAARKAKCRPFREQLKRDVGHCEICGHDPSRAKRGYVAWALDVLDIHEIARGTHRSKAMNKRYALLVVCRYCHMERLSDPAEWPKARQLAALRRSRPEDYNLAAFNALVGWGKNRITEEEVSQWV